MTSARKPCPSRRGLLALALSLLSLAALALPALSQGSGARSSPNASAGGGKAAESNGYTVTLPKPQCENGKAVTPSRRLLALSGSGNGSFFVKNEGNADLSIVIEGKHPATASLPRHGGFLVFVGPGDRVYAENAECGKTGKVRVTP